MAQTYSQFKTWITEFAWRQNDTDLANNLDKIIRMADATLNRKLNIQRRQVTTQITPSVEDYSLPSDFYQVLSLTNNQTERQRRRAEMQSTTIPHIYQLRELTDSQYIEPYYATERAASANTLYLCGPFATTAGDFQLVYRTAIPDFETDDASWVEADYLDLYTYTVLYHAAAFLREDDRKADYMAQMNQALEEALDEDNREVRFGGSPLHMKPHHYVPRRWK